MVKNKKKKVNPPPDLQLDNSTSDLEILDFLKRTIINQIKEGKINLKVGDLLKVLEIQRKLSTDTTAEQKFWELIEQIRQTELSKD